MISMKIVLILVSQILAETENFEMFQIHRKKFTWSLWVSFKEVFSSNYYILLLYTWGCIF